MFTNEILDKLKSDSNLGAGNFVYKLMEIAEGLDELRQDSIFLDHSYKAPNGKVLESFSISTLVDMADELANWYLEQGVSPKDPVGLFISDGVGYYIHFVALTSIGAIPTHLNPALQPSIASRFLENINSTLVIVDEFHSSVKELVSEGIRVVDVSSIKTIKGPRTKEVYRHNKTDPVMLVHTSGTTGFPKAVRSDHYPMAFGVMKQLKGNVGTKILNMLPHSHGSGLTIMMSAILRGAKVIVQTDRTPTSIFNTFKASKPDMVIAFPKTFVDMCRYDLEDKGLDCVSFWLAIGDANHESHIKKLIPFGTHTRKGEHREGSVFIDNLGSSEIAYAAFKKTHSLGDVNYGREIGKPFDWMEVAILDNEGNVVPNNTVGMVGVRAECITRGYWNNSFLSEKNRLSGYWLTGDLAYKTDDDRYFHMDRTTDVIETESGPLYSCFTEEAILAKFSSVFECTIVGAANKLGFYDPVLLVELNKNSTDYDLDLLKVEINDFLMEKNIPAIKQVRPEEPGSYTGVTGKKLKRVLREEAVISA